MQQSFDPRRRRVLRNGLVGAVVGVDGLTGCATLTGRSSALPPTQAGGPVRVPFGRAGGSAVSVADIVNRVTWGANTSTMQRVDQVGLAVYLQHQLAGGADALPPSIQSQIDAMAIDRTPLAELVADTERQRLAADATADEDARNKARQDYQQRLNRLAREAATRVVLRSLYSQAQLRQQMTWFWLNHFNVHQAKANLRVMVGDYEDRAIRPHALGKFRNLVMATLRHPAMLRYLDNEQNAAYHVNENYARELMELHTLGVDAGYTQNDVQELARVLTGVGIARPQADPPRLRSAVARFYLRDGLFEFNPNRHDFGDKVVLGRPIVTQGFAEVEEAVDRLCGHPACSRFISRKLAVYFMGADPPAGLQQRMADAYSDGDGDIALVLQTMFESPEFVASLRPGAFKDPMHYVVSAVRLAYDDRPILNAGPMLNWLNRMGEPLFGHQAPDGYPLDEASWSGSGQMITRFEIARAIGSGSAGLFKSDEPQAVEQPAFPQLANALYYQSIQHRLGPRTRQTLDQAGSPQEWNTLLLASPEMMRR